MNGEKNTAPITSDLVHYLQEAAETDNVSGVQSLLLKEFPQSLVDIIRASKWANPLVKACESGNHAVAKVMIRLCPELADIKNEHGSTATHTIAEKGYTDLVRLLAEVNPSSLRAENNHSETPLHAAAINGRSDVVRELVTKFPSSLEKLTSSGDTALHLAVKKSQVECFKELVSQTKLHKQEQLLNAKDNAGNNLLYLATSNKLIEIVRLLLTDQSSECRTMIRVNSMNNQGQTPLQLCNAHSQDTVFIEIGKIIQAAAGQQQSPQHPADISVTDGWTQTSLPIEARNLLLMVLGIFAAAFFTVACNVPPPFLKEDSLAGKTVHVKDVISGGLPRVVYPMILSSAGFMTTMGAIVVLVWPLFFKTILLFLVICTCILYIILVNGIVPEFSVTVWKFRISSIALVWSLVLALVVSGLGMGKCAMLFSRFIHWLWYKGTIRCINTPDCFHI